MADTSTSPTSAADAESSFKNAIVNVYGKLVELFDQYKITKQSQEDDKLMFPSSDAVSNALKGATMLGGGRKKAPKAKGSKGRRGRAGGGEIEDISNIGDLIQDDNHPQNYVGSFGVNSLLSMPAASTSGMRISANSAELLPTGGFNLVDPPLRGGGKPKKTKRVKAKK